MKIVAALLPAKACLELKSYQVQPKGLWALHKKCLSQSCWLLGLRLTHHQLRVLAFCLFIYLCVNRHIFLVLGCSPTEEATVLLVAKIEALG